MCVCVCVCVCVIGDSPMTIEEEICKKKKKNFGYTILESNTQKYRDIIKERKKERKD